MTDQTAKVAELRTRLEQAKVELTLWTNAVTCSEALREKRNWYRNWEQWLEYALGPNGGNTRAIEHYQRELNASRKGIQEMDVEPMRKVFQSAPENIKAQGVAQIESQAKSAQRKVDQLTSEIRLIKTILQAHTALSSAQEAKKTYESRLFAQLNQVSAHGRARVGVKQELLAKKVKKQGDTSQEQARLQQDILSIEGNLPFKEQYNKAIQEFEAKIAEWEKTILNLQKELGKLP